MITKQSLKQDIDKLAKKEIELEIRSRNNQRKGLCKNCVRAENCSLSHNTNSIIWDCDDFTNSQEVFQEIQTKNTENETEYSKSSTANPGLCSYCVYKDNCSLKSIEGGVWHCAEYA